MLASFVDLTDTKQSLKRLFNAPWRALVGATFVVLAMAAIEYEEHIGPQVNRLSEGWSTVADFSRRLTSFTL